MKIESNINDVIDKLQKSLSIVSDEIELNKHLKNIKCETHNHIPLAKKQGNEILFESCCKEQTEQVNKIINDILT